MNTTPPQIESYDASLLASYYLVGPRDDDIRRMMAFDGWVRSPTIEEAEVIIFQGGPDINPMLYGEKRHDTTHIDFKRDLEDIRALRQWKGPYEQMLVGICRGAQFLNVMVGGGTLWQNVNNHTRPHNLLIREPEKAVIQTSSTHHQMMCLGPNAVVLASAVEATQKEGHNKTVRPDLSKSLDPEVVFYPALNTLCFQGHPEYTNVENKPFQNYFLKTISSELLSGSSKEKRLAAKMARCKEMQIKRAL